MKYSNWKNTFIRYIKNNYREYLLISLIFIIGLFIGVFIVNNISKTQQMEIVKYINIIIKDLKKIEKINKIQLFIQSIKKSLLFAIILWGAGTTVVGLPIVLLAILLKGAILGATISSITISLGTIKGVLFCTQSLVVHNIIYIPAIITIGVSSVRLYKSIVEDKRKEKIKFAIIRHTIISTIMILLLVLSAIIENYITISILKEIIKYF